jgi:hypothetical protein
VAPGVLVTGIQLEFASRVQRPRRPSGPSARTTRPPPLRDGLVEFVELGETATVGVGSGMLEASEVVLGRGVSPAAQPETAIAAANPVATTPRRIPDTNILPLLMVGSVAAVMAATGY